MPEVDLDFGGVGKVPEGWFRLEIDKAIYKKNKDGDAYLIQLQMHLTDMPTGTMPDSDVEYEMFENMTVFDRASMKLSARRFLRTKLRAITQEDWDEDGMKLKLVCDECGDDEDCPHTEKHVPLLEGKTVVGLIGSELYQGELQARVLKWLPDDGAIEFGPDVTE